MPKVRYDESRHHIVADCRRCRSEQKVRLLWRQNKNWRKWRLVAVCGTCDGFVSQAKRMVAELGVAPPPMPDITRQVTLFEE